MRDWYVVVANRCADVCMQEFRITDRERARAWLYELIDKRGRVTDALPSAMAHLQGKASHFMLVDGVVVLPLKRAKDGTARLIATDCKVFPSYRRRYGASAEVDPFSLTGARLMRHVDLSTKAVQRFQRLGAAHPNQGIAREQLRRALAADARAVSHPPSWYASAGAVTEADFYLVASDEYVLPISRKRTAGLAFEALTCVHRANDLFALRGAQLAARCRFADSALTISPPHRQMLISALTADGRLSWRRPEWAREHPSARFWAVSSMDVAAPVAWQPEDERRPLIILDVAERLSPLRRVGRWVKSKKPDAAGQ